jgi:hypothetical protein
LRNYSSGFSIYSCLQYKTGKNAGEGRIQTVNTIHLEVPAGFHTSQLVLHAVCRVSDKPKFSYNYFVNGEDEKSHFSIPGDTIFMDLWYNFLSIANI